MEQENIMNYEFNTYRYTRHISAYEIKMREVLWVHILITAQ